MLVKSVRTSHFRICENESQPGLQQIEKLATPLVLKSMFTSLKTNQRLLQGKRRDTQPAVSTLTLLDSVFSRALSNFNVSKNTILLGQNV